LSNSYSRGVSRTVEPATVTSRRVGSSSIGPRVRHPRASEHGSDPGVQLIHGERLGEVVVGARLETVDLVAFVAARREDDDGRRGLAPNAPDHIDAIEIGQAQVEQHQVRSVGVPEAHRFVSRGGGEDFVSAAAEVLGQGLSSAGFVLDEQQRGPAHRRSSDDVAAVAVVAAVVADS
jgi:hypothetical protein